MSVLREFVVLGTNLLYVEEGVTRVEVLDPHAVRSISAAFNLFHA